MDYFSEENFLLEYINKALCDTWKAKGESLEEMTRRKGTFTDIQKHECLLHSVPYGVSCLSVYVAL
jgi:hypothetical protein